jgi:hypothetical protein
VTQISLEPFSAGFSGSEGDYKVVFVPNDAGEGLVQTTIGVTPMAWNVDFVGLDESGEVVLGGLTRGSTVIWGDIYWFSIQAKADAPWIEYWGDQVLWRKDLASMIAPRVR